jgi:16S rRNA processing protein RimM
MDKKDFYYLGKIVKTSGFKGSLMFFFDVDDITPYKNLEAVFVEVGDDLIPFAIQSINVKSSTSAYVQLEDVNTDEEAFALTGKSLYLPLSFLPPLTGDKFYYHEVIGFEVVDRRAGKIGVLESVMDQGPQDIFIIRAGDREVLLPASDDILLKVDRDKRVLHVNTPEGLLNLYLD